MIRIKFGSDSVYLNVFRVGYGSTLFGSGQIELIRPYPIRPDRIAKSKWNLFFDFLSRDALKMCLRHSSRRARWDWIQGELASILFQFQVLPSFVPFICASAFLWSGHVNIYAWPGGIYCSLVIRQPRCFVSIQMEPMEMLAGKFFPSVPDI